MMNKPNTEELSHKEMNFIIINWKILNCRILNLFYKSNSRTDNKVNNLN